MLHQDLGSLPKSRIPHLAWFCHINEETIRGMGMSDIVKVCKKHGELTSKNICVNNRCVFCQREYAKDYRLKHPEKTKAANEKYRELVKEYKSHGYEYKKSRKNNKYYEGRTSIECKKHGFIEGKDLIKRENNYLRCRLCAYERNRTWEKKNPDKVRSQKRRTYLSNCDKYSEESRLRQRKITAEQYNELLLKQNSLCKICNKPETKKMRKDGTESPLSIDHCHSTNKVRGLLCNKCNSGLGFFKDSIELLQEAINYLKGFDDDKSS